MKTENERLTKELKVYTSDENPDRVRLKFVENELAEVGNKLSANEEKLKKIGEWWL